MENEETLEEGIEKVEGSTSEPQKAQDPLKSELDRVKNREGKTELEKAQFSLRKNAERLKELGGDPSAIIGIEPKSESDENDDDAPVTVGMLKKLQQETAQKTAIDLATGIENETERELTIYHLKNSIKSTGNPQEDLNLARAIVNSAKNAQIVEEIERKNPAKSHSNASSASAKHEEEIVLTQEELGFMKPPFNLTKAQILNARQGK